MNFTPNKLSDVDWAKIPADVVVLHRPETCYWDGEVQVEEDVCYVKNLTVHEGYYLYRGDIVNSFFRVIATDAGFAGSIWVRVERPEISS